MPFTPRRRAGGPRALLHAILLATCVVPHGAGADGLDLESRRGEVIYIDFWASWCKPCRASFPWMNALQAELGERGLTVIGVNTGDTPEEAARFLDAVPAEFEIVVDDDGALARELGVQGMPMAYVFDRDGTLVASHIGFNERSSEERADAIRTLVEATR